MGPGAQWDRVELLLQEQAALTLRRKGKILLAVEIPAGPLHERLRCGILDSLSGASSLAKAGSRVAFPRGGDT